MYDMCICTFIDGWMIDGYIVTTVCDICIYIYIYMCIYIYIIHIIHIHVYIYIYICAYAFVCLSYIGRRGSWPGSFATTTAQASYIKIITKKELLEKNY